MKKYIYSILFLVLVVPSVSFSAERNNGGPETFNSSTSIDLTTHINAFKQGDTFYEGSAWYSSPSLAGISTGDKAIYAYLTPFTASSIENLENIVLDHEQNVTLSYDIGNGNLNTPLSLWYNDYYYGEGVDQQYYAFWVDIVEYNGTTVSPWLASIGHWDFVETRYVIYQYDSATSSYILQPEYLGPPAPPENGFIDITSPIENQSFSNNTPLMTVFFANQTGTWDTLIAEYNNITDSVTAESVASWQFLNYETSNRKISVYPTSSYIDIPLSLNKDYTVRFNLVDSNNLTDNSGFTDAITFDTFGTYLPPDIVIDGSTFWESAKQDFGLVDLTFPECTASGIDFQAYLECFYDYGIRLLVPEQSISLLYTAPMTTLQFTINENSPYGIISSYVNAISQSFTNPTESLDSHEISMTFVNQEIIFLNEDTLSSFPWAPRFRNIMIVILWLSFFVYLYKRLYTITAPVNEKIS